MCKEGAFVTGSRLYEFRSLKSLGSAGEIHEEICCIAVKNKLFVVINCQESRSMQDGATAWKWDPPTLYFRRLEEDLLPSKCVEGLVANT